MTDVRKAVYKMSDEKFDILFKELIAVPDKETK